MRAAPRRPGALWKAGLALLAALAAGFFTSPARADALDAIRGRSELAWGGDLQGGAPYVYEDAANPGKLRGFEVDIAEALARRLGVRARFVQNDWSNLLPALERGDFDLVLNGLEETQARRERLLLSSPYFVYGETLAVRAGSPYGSLDELRGKRVGTLNQTVAHDLLKARPLEVVLYEGQQEPYLDLANGRIDAVLLDHVIADVYGCVLPAVRCLPGDVAKGVYVAGIRKNQPELKRAIDDALGAMSAEGELRRILTGYKLWDPRQDELAARNPKAASPRSLGLDAPSPAMPVRHFDAAQLGLFVHGALVTLAISVAAFAIALPFGLLLAIARGYGSRAVALAAAAYVEVFRGTPVLLQLYVLYFGLAPLVRLGPFAAAVLGLGLNYAAYEAEVHRGALLAVPHGQSEAARALGLGTWQALRHVLLPQSLKNALPALTNDFVALLKDSSLVSVITVVELTKRMTIAAVDLRDWAVPGFLCAALYFALSFPLSRLSLYLERTLAHDPHPRPA
jgi:polar amino acid transport system substrate-binding protein